MNKQIKIAALLFIAFLGITTTGCSTKNLQQQTTDEASSIASNEEYTSISLLCDVDFWEPPVWDPTEGTITGDISKKTGAVLNVMETTQDADTQLKILLLNDKLPDLISVTDSTAISQLVSSGKVWQLDEFLQTYKPDSHLLTFFPEDMKEELIKRDGAWYAFPSHINSADAREKWPPTKRYEAMTKYGSNNAIIWNKKLLELMDLSVEELTTEEQVLAAFEKAKNMEVDGEKIIPLLIDGNVWQDSTLSFLQNSFGAEWLDENDEYMDISLQPQTKNALKFLNTVMSKGYAQPKQINMDVKALQDAIQNHPYLCFIGNLNDTGVMMDEWVSSGPVLSSDGSSPVFGVSSRASTGWISTFISKKCEHPQEVAEFLDYMTSEKGMELWCMGYEGTDFRVNDEGYYECLISADEVEKKKLHIWWMFVNTAWERSTIKDETELALSDDAAHTAYASDEHVVTFDSSLYQMPDGFITVGSEEGQIEKAVNEWKAQQLTKVMLAENESTFEQQYGVLINGLKAKGIEQLDAKKQEGYRQNCEEYGIENHKINTKKEAGEE